MKEKNINITVSFSFIFAFIYLLIGFNYGLNIYDEAIGIFGAERVLQGDIPYKDFWSLYAPGQYYFLAGLSYIFGGSILMERIVTTIILFLLAVTVYKISSKLLTKLSALIPFFMTVLWAASFNFYSRAIPTALLLSLISVYFLFRYIDREKLPYIFLTGVFAGLTALFRHDVGLYTAFGIVASIIMYSILGLKDDRSINILGKILLLTTRFLLGFLIIITPVALLLLSYVPSEELYSQLAYIPMNIFGKYRALPFPIPFKIIEESGTPTMSALIKSFWEGIVFYIPILLYLITIFLNVKNAKEVANRRNIILSSIIVLIGLLYYTQASVRSDTEHLFPTFMIAIILMVYIYKNIQFRMIQTIVLAAVLIFCAALPLATKAQKVKNSLTTPNETRLSFSKAKGITLEPEWGADYIKTLKFINDSIPVDKVIFVANQDNDHILLNDVMLYYLSERKPATKYHEFHPGVTNTKEVQDYIVNELSAQNVEYIISVLYGPSKEPNESSNQQNLNILDNYIKKHYSTAKVYGNYSILKRTKSI